MQEDVAGSADLSAHAASRGRLGESAASLAAALEFEKQLDLQNRGVYHFASLQLAEDSANAEYLHAHGAAAESDDENWRDVSFVTPEVQAINDEQFAEFLNAPVLAEWDDRLAQAPPQ
jgi:oligoendopeptidase F